MKDIPKIHPFDMPVLDFQRKYYDSLSDDGIRKIVLIKNSGRKSPIPEAPKK